MSGSRYGFRTRLRENLKIIRLCHKYHKRVIFPSTSEVYGMSPDQKFDEESSPLMLGPDRQGALDLFVRQADA